MNKIIYINYHNNSNDNDNDNYINTINSNDYKDNVMYTFQLIVIFLNALLQEDLL